ncbi:MAG: NADH-quinone oxidoreductase subunit B [Candidatus Omnitrophica bacterium]|nr:NADH-quinone oxidoreductase subunit B [Candidatus Omnitrophota bacterium]
MEVSPPDPGTQSPPVLPLELFRLEEAVDFCRSSSLWPLTFGLACCAIEMIGLGASRFDIERYGYGVFRASPRQADLMIVAGTVSRKMAPCIKTLYDQMAAPKYVVAYGGCAIAGGPFKFPGQYGILEGIDKIIPVNVYIPGCPPRPEALLAGLLKLRDLIRQGKADGRMSPAAIKDFSNRQNPVYKDAISRDAFRNAAA